VAFLFLLDALWLRLLNAVLLAFVFTHLGFLVHDAGHRQIFGRPGQNDLIMLLLGVLLGSSRSWWFETHNRHHAYPNDLDRDPHTAIAVLAFSPGQASGRGRLLRATTRFQAYYFFPLLFLEGLGVRLASLRFVIAGKSRFPVPEALAIVLHIVLYAWLLFTAMPIGAAVLFILVHQSVAGLYMGSLFAPNHKGMLIVNEDSDLDYVRRQVLSSRNVRPHPLVDFLFGGLNYQIEHHLFPVIPRTRLKAARLIVKEFCAERSIAYHETGVWQAYSEVLSHLNTVVKPVEKSSNEIAESRPA
jgi:fatty acid desaturase